MSHFTQGLNTTDPDVFASINREYNRQHLHLEMIASENYTSEAVLQAMGSVGGILTNKYAEGYPGKRYYGGCEYVDEVETLAINRAQDLFSIDGFKPFVNVQAHSGSQANQAVFLACLKPGDKILSCDLSHGGHLTHGSKVNLSGKWFEIAHYGVDKATEKLDYQAIQKQAQEFKPKLIIAGYSAYSRIIDFKKFREIADEIGAYLLVDMAHIAGLVAGKQHPSPFPHAHFVTSTTHKTLRGPRGGLIMTNEDWSKKINSGIFPGIQGGPLMHTIAGKAVMFLEAQSTQFKTYCKNIINNTQALVNSLQELDFKIVSGGSDNHLILVNLTNKEITGKETEIIFDKVGINANRNTIPFDTENPFVTSGVRLGTPAITSRGMMEKDMVSIAEFIDETIKNKGNEKKLNIIKEKVTSFCSKFPIYAPRG